MAAATATATVAAAAPQFGPSVQSRPGMVPLTCACIPSSSSSSPSLTVSSVRHSNKQLRRKESLFFLDVNPICFNGSKPSLLSFAFWLRLFFSKVSLRNPVIAVLDGEEGNEYRRNLLPSYKANRICRNGGSSGWLRSAEPRVVDILHNCNVPVVKVKEYEADDVIATLTDQAIESGFRVVIGSPDKDFKQLISENVQLALPVPDLNRWCFYALKHYFAQYGCDPTVDLSLRCFMGDEVDGVPGIQKFVPGFGRKTAVKLLKRHGTLENLLSTAAVRTVGKHYAQDTLTKYADYLRTNYQVLSLRRDAKTQLEESWLQERDSCNDSLVLNDFINKLNDGRIYRSRERMKKIIQTSSN